MPTLNLGIDYLLPNPIDPHIEENMAKDIADGAICGQLTISMIVNTDYTLEIISTTYPQEWQNKVLIVDTVAHTSLTNVILPDGKKMNYIFINNSGSASNITFKTTTGTGVSVPDGGIYEMYSDGTNIYRISIS